MKEIVQAENEILRGIAEPVSEKQFGSKELKGIIQDMRDALASQHDGVAIAAPQIGVALRIFVVSHRMFGEDANPNDDLVFINPTITKISKKHEGMDEGCLSVRWKYGTVSRAVKATVRAYDANGKVFTYNGSDLMAQIFQHETDHLDGVLFIDKATNVKDVPPEEIEKMQHGDNT